MRSKLDKQVYPFLGARALSVISATTIRDWLSWTNGNDVSESHKSQVFDLLSAVLSSAVDEKKFGPIRVRQRVSRSRYQTSGKSHPGPRLGCVQYNSLYHLDKPS